jgi:prepilin-type N-terminal cleavage/methylation domain-containing protein
MTAQHRTRPGRPARAFTLIEVIMASLLVAVALLATLGLIIMLNEQTSAELSRTELDRHVTSLDGQLAQDVATARPCRPDRAAPVFTDISPNRLSWTIDPDGAGQTQQVTWRLVGAHLMRSVVTDQGGCEFPQAGTACGQDDGEGASVRCSVVVHGLSIDMGRSLHDTLGLYAVPVGLADADGIAVDPADYFPGDCAAAGMACLDFSTVRLRTVATTRDGTLVPLSRDLTMPPRRSRLAADPDA